jgi:hypothetical protein
VRTKNSGSCGPNPLNSCQSTKRMIKDVGVDGSSDRILSLIFSCRTKALKSPLLSPKVMVPKQSFETRRPVSPRVAYSMMPFQLLSTYICRRLNMK